MPWPPWGCDTVDGSRDRHRNVPKDAVGLEERRQGCEAVLLHEQLGVAVDVEVGDHLRRTRFTAASASEAVMSGRARWTIARPWWGLSVILQSCGSQPSRTMFAN